MIRARNAVAISIVACNANSMIQDPIMSVKKCWLRGWLIREGLIFASILS